MADFIVKILLETKQPVPDFLESRVPEKIEFDDDSGIESEDEAGGAGGDDGDAWGSGDAGAPVVVETITDDTWGAPAGNANVDWS